MPIPLPSFAFHSPRADDRGYALAFPAMVASQRASLGRGIAFVVLLLTAASLAFIYVPLAMHGPDWVEGTAPGPLVADR